MLHSCKEPNCPECLPGFVYRPSPKKGTTEWKDDVAFQYCNQKGCLNKTAVRKIPDYEGEKIGYVAIRYSSGVGTDYFRVDDIL